MAPEIVETPQDSQDLEVGYNFNIFFYFFLSHFSDLRRVFIAFFKSRPADYTFLRSL